MNEPQFLFDESSHEDRNELKTVIDIVSKKPEHYDKNAVFLKKFLFALFDAAAPKKKEKKEKIIKIPDELKKKYSFKVKKSQLVMPYQRREKPKEVVKKPVVPLQKNFVKPREDVLNKFVSVKLENRNGKHYYNLIEPELMDVDLRILTELKQAGVEKLKSKDFLTNEIRSLMGKYNLEDQNFFNKIFYFANREINGFGKIDAIVRDGRIRGIYCEGPLRAVMVDYNDLRLMTNIYFDDDNEINYLIRRMATTAGRVVSPENPSLDVVLAIGTVWGNLGVGTESAKFSIKR